MKSCLVVVAMALNVKKWALASRLAKQKESGIQQNQKQNSRKGTHRLYRWAAAPQLPHNKAWNRKKT